MPLSPIQVLIIIVCVALGTMITRFLPFILFPDGRRVPSYISYLGDVLPYAVIGMLVVYCLKEIDISEGAFALPEIIAVALTVGLHLWRRNTLLSIAGGTICYMLLVQFIFI